MCTGANTEISPSEIITVVGKRGNTLQNSSRKRTVTTFKLYYVTQEFSDFSDLQIPTSFAKQIQISARRTSAYCCPACFSQLPSEGASETPPGPCSPEAEEGWYSYSLKMLCQRTKVNKWSSDYFILGPEEVCTW